VNIYDAAQNLVFTDQIDKQGSFSRVYDLTKVHTSTFTFEVLGQGGILAKQQFYPGVRPPLTGFSSPSFKGQSAHEPRIPRYGASVFAGDTQRGQRTKTCLTSKRINQLPTT
jgi:hypothetical protein